MDTALTIALIVIGVLLLIVIWGMPDDLSNLSSSYVRWLTSRLLLAACSCAGCCDSGPMLVLPDGRGGRGDDWDEEDTIWSANVRIMH